MTLKSSFLLICLEEKLLDQVGNFSHGLENFTSYCSIRSGILVMGWKTSPHSSAWVSTCISSGLILLIFHKGTFTDQVVLHFVQDECFRYFLNLLQQYFVRLIHIHMHFKYSNQFAKISTMLKLRCPSIDEYKIDKKKIGRTKT